MFGAHVRYPFRFRWSDGTETRFESEAAHLAGIATCTHEDAVVMFEGVRVGGCWKCLSMPLWVRS